MFETPKLNLDPLANALSAKPPDIPIAVLINGIFIAEDHDPSSPHGEFYWTSEVADGRKMPATSSGTEPFGNISAGQWLPTPRRFPIYSSDVAPPAGTVTVQFRLFESDDYSETANILKQGAPFFGDGVKMAVEALTGGVGGAVAEKVTEQAVSLVATLLSADGDDTVIDERYTLLGVEKHYSVGRFFRLLEGRGGSCAAIFSVISTTDVGDNNHYYEYENNIIGYQEYTYNVPKDGMLSFFVRKIHYPGYPKAKVEVVKRGGGFERTREFYWWQIRNYLVSPGTYDIRVTTFHPADLEVMFTALGDRLAHR